MCKDCHQYYLNFQERLDRLKKSKELQFAKWRQSIGAMNSQTQRIAKLVEKLNRLRDDEKG